MTQIHDDSEDSDAGQPKGQGRRRITLTNTSTTSRPLFLERRVYQHRRLSDAAKLLPIAGLFLFLMPALLLGSADGDAATGATSLRLIYFFFVWICLIATCAVIARGLAGTGTPYDAARNEENEDRS